MFNFDVTFMNRANGKSHTIKVSSFSFTEAFGFAFRAAMQECPEILGCGAELHVEIGME